MPLIRLPATVPVQPLVRLGIRDWLKRPLVILEASRLGTTPDEIAVATFGPGIFSSAVVTPLVPEPVPPKPVMIAEIRPPTPGIPASRVCRSENPSPVVPPNPCDIASING